MKLLMLTMASFSRLRAQALLKVRAGRTSEGKKAASTQPSALWAA